MGWWIDHRKTVLVTIPEEGEKTTRIYSVIEVDAQFSGSSRSAGSQDVDSIQIFGPGEAKGERLKHLKSKNRRKQIVSIETTDKLTDPQIAAKVRQHYPK